MTILFVCLDIGYAGHSRDAVAVARGLLELGNAILFIVGNDSDPGLLIEEDIPFVRATSAKCFQQELHNIVLNHDVDVVHVFSQVQMHAVVTAAVATGKPVLVTLCGGSPAMLYPPVPIVCTSRELVENLGPRHVLGQQHVHHIPERFDSYRLEQQRRNDNHGNIRSILEKLCGVAEAGMLIVRVARVSEAYVRSIAEGAWAVRRLNEDGIRATFVHIGGESTNVRVKDRLESAINEANCGRDVPVAISIGHDPSLAIPTISAADLVIGTGLTALEGLYFKKPVIVVGKRGFAGLLSSATIEEIAHFNFSGRNVADNLPSPISVARIVETIKMIAADPDDTGGATRSLGDYIESMSYKRGSEKYLRLYEEYEDSAFRISTAYRVLGSAKTFILGKKRVRRLISRISHRR